MGPSLSLTSLFSWFILVSFLLESADGWGIAPGQCKIRPNTSDNNSNSDRRDFLQSSLSTFTTVASIGTLSSQTATTIDVEDPFAALDSFAASVGSTPPSNLNNPPTTGNSASPSSDAKGASQPAGSSDMSEALKDIRKQKTIGPTTHG
ncbi:MAG: hypothetical protein SGBAC_007462 [Bacillariaceae sp.]